MVRSGCTLSPFIKACYGLVALALIGVVSGAGSIDTGGGDNTCSSALFAGGDTAGAGLESKCAVDGFARSAPNLQNRHRNVDGG